MPVLEAVMEKSLHPAFSVERISQWSQLQPLSSAWAKLASECAPEDYFMSWDWAHSWWAAYGTDFEMFVLICRNTDNEVLGIAPWYRTSWNEKSGLNARCLRFIGGGTDDVDGFGLLARPDRERELVKALLDWLASNTEEWDILQLDSMPEESACACELQAYIRQRSWVERVHWAPHMVVELPKTWEAYLEGLSRKTRQTWQRRLRNAQRDFSLTLRRSETEAAAGADLQTVFNLHQKSWNARGAAGKMDLAARLDFYRRTVSRAAQTGALDLWLLELDGVPRAARLGFRAGQTRHAVIAGMDPAFAPHSLGTVCEALVLKACIERGDRFYDFLSGDELYKIECAATRKRYMNVTVARPRTRAGIWLSTQSTVQVGKKWLRTKAPSIYRLLRGASSKKNR